MLCDPTTTLSYIVVCLRPPPIKTRITRALGTHLGLRQFATANIECLYAHSKDGSQSSLDAHGLIPIRSQSALGLLTVFFKIAHGRCMCS